jgi:hypothetical protein
MNFEKIFQGLKVVGVRTQKNGKYVNRLAELIALKITNTKAG